MLLSSGPFGGRGLRVSCVVEMLSPLFTLDVRNQLARAHDFLVARCLDALAAVPRMGSPWGLQMTRMLVNLSPPRRRPRLEDSNSMPTDIKFRDHLGSAVSWLGIGCTAILILAMWVITAMSFFYMTGNEGARAMGIAIVYFLVIPPAAILAGLACLIGGLMCRAAMRRSGTSEYQTLLRLCWLAPLAAFSCWLACALIILMGSN